MLASKSPAGPSSHSGLELQLLAADNLPRAASEMNLPRPRDSGVISARCDMCNEEDQQLPGHDFDLVIECSASSALTGYGCGAPLRSK